MGEHDRPSFARLGASDLVQPGQRQAQHFLVEKQQGGKGLVLSRGGDLAVGGQPGQEDFDLRCGHVGRMPLAVVQDVALDPVHVGLFGAPALARTRRRTCSSSGVGAGLRSFSGTAVGMMILFHVESCS